MKDKYSMLKTRFGFGPIQCAAQELEKGSALIPSHTTRCHTSFSSRSFMSAVSIRISKSATQGRHLTRYQEAPQQVESQPRPAKKSLVPVAAVVPTL